MLGIDRIGPRRLAGIGLAVAVALAVLDPARFSLADEALITPYYFYMCDMIPFSEPWRLSLAEAQELQHSILGYLPGFATPRIVCDVPFVGKRWVHQADVYDTERPPLYVACTRARDHRIATGAEPASAFL